MDMIAEYFRERLTQMGLAAEPGDVEMCYSLASCQGDGVAFSHKGGCYVPETFLREMANRHYLGTGDKRFRLLQLIQSGECQLKVRHDDHRYTHSNTMKVEASTDYLESDGDVALVEEMAELIKDAVVSASDQLEDEGYNIVLSVRYESEVVREFRTNNYLLRITHEPSDTQVLDFDTRVLADVADNKVEEIFDLRVAILEVDEDGDVVEELADDRLGGMIRYKHESRRQSYGGYLPQMIAEVCGQVRPAKRKPAIVPDLAEAA